MVTKLRLGRIREHVEAQAKVTGRALLRPLRPTEAGNRFDHFRHCLRSRFAGSVGHPSSIGTRWQRTLKRRHRHVHSHSLSLRLARLRRVLSVPRSYSRNPLRSPSRPHVSFSVFLTSLVDGVWCHTMVCSNVLLLRWLHNVRLLAQRSVHLGTGARKSAPQRRVPVDGTGSSSCPPW